MITVKTTAQRERMVIMTELEFIQAYEDYEGEKELEEERAYEDYAERYYNDLYE